MERKCFYSICLIDLALLFKLVNRVPNATNELKKIVEHHIYEMGINTIERVSGAAINVSLRLPFNRSVLQLSPPSYPWELNPAM
jgi:hypothetical protein